MEEVLPEGKNFRLVDESELPEIIEFLANFLPDSIKFHQTLKTFVNDRVWDFHFYVTKNWPEQAVILHFPGMTRTPNNKLYESFSVFCPCDQLDNLELLETEDVLIDWSKPIYLNFTHAKIMGKIEDFYVNIGSMEKLYGDVYGQIEPQADEAQAQAVIAEQGEISQLKQEHAQMIHDLYPANQMECIEVFEKLIDKLPCFGVFSAQGELAAWMVQSYYGAMFSMQTRPEYRRKGYGMLLAKHLTNLVTERGYLPFVVIRPENDASKSLYAKLGFKKYFETVRAILRPYEESGDYQGGGGGGGGTENGALDGAGELNGDVELKGDQ
ncbi:glycine N-acyltransferase-like [Sitophilus oryzae]|uniref:Glycine N-acyltransferase-like n=1 Tax=Sitophilus oryzae TaxID=7048 RepID=A0A6J2Y0E3_SITOR|nr:glycine N-acyltransferase-like [Sitophilus oryzae]XP_030756761.1 glycine N-acyltransferase-like [Sitophilus oryzae]